MTTTELATAVSGANALTRRWLGELDEGNRVLSGAGAWPVLAAALSGADGPARAELETTLGVARDEAGACLRALSNLLSQLVGLSTALALWTAPGVDVHDAYQTGLGDVETGPMPDQPTADAWVHERTDGLLEACPVTIDQNTLLLLIGVITADGTWSRRFTDGRLQWRGRSVDAVSRIDPDTEAADLIEASTAVGHAELVSRVRCLTEQGFEVHLLGGPEAMSPGEVLTAGIDALEGVAPAHPVTQLADGEHAGMVRVVVGPARPQQAGTLTISVPRFDLADHHDMLERAELFGLVAASEPDRPHFPLISDTPLAVQSAAQDAVATFSAEGFRAAAVTAIGMMRTSMPVQQADVRRFVAEHDRPFGFLVVEPGTRLVLFAGWVADPA